MYVVVFVTQLWNQLPYSLVSLRMLTFDENEYPCSEQIIIFLYCCYALNQIFVLNGRAKRYCFKRPETKILFQEWHA